MRLLNIAPGEYYHIFNRGVHKQVIFHDQYDYSRFLFLILHLQSPLKFPQVGRLSKQFVKHSVFDIDQSDVEKIISDRTIELIAFCIMPNHFHLVVKEIDERGIAVYMQRVLNAYAKYYNTKYSKSGHVFQGPYRAVHVENDRQMSHLSAYIHKNPREISKWFNKEDKYIWSSYNDYVAENRWGKILMTEYLIKQFGGMGEYKNFVNTSPAKMHDEELNYLRAQ